MNFWIRLIEIWQDPVRKAYMEGLICSERALQAFVFTELNKLSEYKCWVEPILSIKKEMAGEKMNEKFICKPDLVLTRGNEISCIIELKYVPQSTINFEEDILKLTDISKLPGDFSFRLKINPSNGHYTDDRFSLSIDVLYVFAAIAEKEAWGLYVKNHWYKMKKEPFPLENFMQLQGIVENNAEIIFKPASLSIPENISISDIKVLFYNEFRLVADKFVILEVPVKDAVKDQSPCIWHPGVYVFWRQNRVIKVGRHLENSRKRALEHVRDNTHNDQYSISELANHDDTMLILFNLEKLQDHHWAAALEIYFEEKLQPAIKSKRTG